MRPLFIPLKTEYYRAFERGDKTQEFRLHGKRWNGGTCRPGRQVILSRGYGKYDRLCGVVSSFHATPLSALQGLQKIAFRGCYPSAIDTTLVAIIGIEVTR